MLKRKFFSILFIVLSVSAASSIIQTSYADTELENEDLARIVHVLDSLNGLINAAQAQQNPNARVQFRYDWLRQDINSIRSGINQKLNPNWQQPHVIAPIKGDYVTLRSKAK